MNALEPIQQTDLSVVGQSANKAAQQYVFEDYHQRRAKKTIETHRASLVAWMRYLAQVGAVSTIIYKWRTFVGAAKLQRSGPGQVEKTR